MKRCRRELLCNNDNLDFKESFDSSKDMSFDGLSINMKSLWDKSFSLLFCLHSRSRTLISISSRSVSSSSIDDKEERSSEELKPVQAK